MPVKDASCPLVVVKTAAYFQNDTGPNLDPENKHESRHRGASLRGNFGIVFRLSCPAGMVVLRALGMCNGRDCK